MKPRHLPILLLPLMLLMASCGGENMTLEPVTQPVAAVAGTVRNPEGTPLADVVVTLDRLVNGRAASVDKLLGEGDLQPESKAGAADATTSLRSTVTDDAGRYAFADVPAGSYVLEGRLADHLAASRQVQKAAGDTTFVDIDLTPTGTLTGVVDRIDVADDRGTVVYVEGTSYVAVSAADGSYAMTGVPIGPRQLFAEYPGYVRDQESATLSTAGETVAVPAMSLARILNMPPTGSFQVLDPGPYYQNNPIRFLPSAADDDGTVVSYEFRYDDAATPESQFDASSATPDTFSTSYGSAGEKIVKLRVRDDDGGYGFFASRITIGANQPPAVTLSGPSVVTQGTVGTFTATITDPENDIALVAWDTTGTGLQFDVLTGTVPSLDVVATTLGSRTIAVRVTDGGLLTATGSFGYLVEPAPLHVSPAGSPTGAGTPGDPLASVQAALDRAQAEGRPSVLVALGTYNETITLRNGIDLLGGRDPQNGWAATALRSSVVAQGAGRHNSFGNNVTFTVESIDFQATTVTTASSYGLLLSTGFAPIEFVNCRFESRNAVAGTAGAGGPIGASGGAGASGTNGSCDDGNGNGGPGGTSIVGCPGGAGGRGGLEDGPYNGSPGTTGGCSGGGGGSGGSGGDPGGDGLAGVAGVNGAGGTAGLAAPNTSGATGSSLWSARTSGTGGAGVNGRGGGGGGGGGAQEGGIFVDNGGGNGGGGGGGGAQGGGGGTGGVGGQGSFAVFMVFANANFTDCVFVTGNGGNGGNGGIGAAGGVGGNGGFGATACSSEIGTGGNGGRGGNGGAGGGGAGGPGGPSLGIYSEGSAQVVTSSTFQLGNAGAGGLGGGGGNTGQGGPTGIRTNVYIR